MEIISVSIDPSMLDTIDEYLDGLGVGTRGRSGFIRKAINERLKSLGVVVPT